MCVHIINILYLFYFFNFSKIIVDLKHYQNEICGTKRVEKNKLSLNLV